MVKNVYSKGNIGGYHTNHSLPQQQQQTHLLDADIDEQLINEVTSHRSLAVCNHKHVSDTKYQKINEVIQGSSSDTAKNITTVTTLLFRKK